jgi:hypothetical protein
MNKSQYIELTERRGPESRLQVGVKLLRDQSDRTLLYGYTVERNTWHVYLLDGLIYLHIYNPQRTFQTSASAAWAVNDLIPNKRLYPEACDHEFCTLLTNLGADLPFTSFSENRPGGPFYGKV